jgi:nucleotide-binding universal stress UspA family protein
MLPIHTILHPTDFSEQSGYALLLAGALARDYGARLVVLHAVAPPTVAYGEGIIPPEPDLLLDEARAQLEQLKVPDASVPTERRFEEGDPATEILHTAGEIHADLIVMGTHGRTGLSRLLMGSVAEQVMRQAPCPVLIVKTPFPEAEPSSSRLHAEQEMATVA